LVAIAAELLLPDGLGQGAGVYSWAAETIFFFHMTMRPGNTLPSPTAIRLVPSTIRGNWGEHGVRAASALVAGASVPTIV